MFKLTSKHQTHTQEYLKASSLSTLKQTTSLLCDSIYQHSYDADLPEASVEILNYIVRGLTGANDSVDRLRRSLHTMFLWKCGTSYTCRCCFIQQELCSATGQFKVKRAGLLESAYDRLRHSIPQLTRARIVSFNESVQVSGRLAPYVVDASGLLQECNWTYCNAGKTRLLFIVTSDRGSEVSTLTKRSLDIISAHCPNYGVCVYLEDMMCFRITSAPSASDTSPSANKNTAVMLYCDGSFRVQGTPHKAEMPCKCLREALCNVSVSRSWDTFVASLRLVEDQDSQQT